MVGLSVGVGGFISYDEEQKGSSSGKAYQRLEACAVEAGGRHGLERVKQRGGGIAFVGESLEAAVNAANDLTQEFVQEPGYLPVHVTVHERGVIELEDGRSVEVAPSVRLSAHQGEMQPVKRT